MKREHKTSGELPSGFDKLEYIESTGTQYLMTNHYPTAKTHIITDIQYTREDTSKGGFNFVRWSNVSGMSHSFGICDASNSNHYIHIYWGNFDHGGHHTFGTNTSSWFLQKHHIEIHENVSTVDNETYTYPNQDAYFPSTIAMPILGGATIDQATTSAYCRCWYIQVYNDTELVYDCIPVLRTSDNKPGMFNFVTEEFMTNVGSGEFLYN